MAELRWTDEACIWMREIFDYISIDNSKIAKRVIQDIYKRVQVLKEFPKIGHSYLENSEREIRILTYGHYRIVYLVKPNEDIDVLGVFHDALDIDRYLI